MMPLDSQMPGPTGTPSRPGGSSSTTRSAEETSTPCLLMSNRQIEPSRPLAAITGRDSAVPSSWIIRYSSLTSMLSGLMAMSPPAAITWSALYRTSSQPSLSGSLWRCSSYARPSSLAPVAPPVVTNTNWFGSARLNAPSSGRAKRKAPSASLAASSSASPRVPAFGMRSQPTLSLPFVNDASLSGPPSLAGTRTYSSPLSSPFRRRTPVAERSFVPTYMYSWLFSTSGARALGPSSMPMATVRLPSVGWMSVFSQAKRPSFGSVYALLSTIATARPPLPSNELV